MYDDTATLVALTSLDGVGDARALELFRAFETRNALLKSPLTAFEEYHYIDDGAYTQLQQLESTIQETATRFEQYRDSGISVIGIDDERYPAPLRYEHAPLVLYCRGETSLLNADSVSISGSRETTSVGLQWTETIATELASDGYTIVSGGALGVDTAAHKAARDAGGTTIAVLGTGVDVPYPKANEALFSDIVDEGNLLVSHRLPGAQPARHAFIERNKTISALSTGIVIVAAGESSGTMAQYRIAREQGRQVIVPSSELKIKPADGLEKVRSTDGVTVVSPETPIQTELPTQFSGEEDTQMDSREDVSGNSQSDLSDWG